MGCKLLDIFHDYTTQNVTINANMQNFPPTKSRASNLRLTNLIQMIGNSSSELLSSFHYCIKIFEFQKSEQRIWIAYNIHFMEYLISKPHIKYRLGL